LQPRWNISVALAKSPFFRTVNMLKLTNSILKGHEMDNPRGWTDYQIEVLEKQWGEGMPASRIAAEIGKSRNAVLGVISRRGITGPNTMSDSRVDCVARTAEMMSEGMTIGKMADAMRVNVSTVKDYMRKVRAAMGIQAC